MKDWRRALPFAVFFFAFVAFLPCLKAPFHIFDDPQNFIENAGYRGLGLSQLRWMFLTFQLGGVYQPLSWLTHALDYLIWGLRPAGFRLDNLLLHCANGVLVFFVVRKLLSLCEQGGPDEAGERGRAWASAFAALFYAMHPLRVEVVAWVSNRSYVVPTFFALASVLSYLEAHRPSPGDGVGRRGWLAVSVTAFACSLLSKSLAIGLPVVLLLLDLYPLGRWDPKKKGFGVGHLLLEKVAYLVILVGAAAVTAYGRSLSGRMIPLSQVGLVSRFAQAVYASLFYLEKTLLPAGLTLFYEAPRIDANLLPRIHPFDDLCFPRTLMFVAATAYGLRTLRRRPGALVLWLSYLALLAPVSGLAKHDLTEQIAADRWAYLPLLVSAPAAAFAVLRLHAALCGRLGERRASLWSAGAGAAALAVLGLLTALQSRRWSSELRVWGHCVDVQPSSYGCRATLARLLNDGRRHQEALVQARESARIAPTSNVPRYELIRAYDGLGLGDSAQHEAEEARALNPAANIQAGQRYFMQGASAAQRGDMDAAMELTQTAVRLDPANPGAQYNLGYFFQTRGRLDESEKHYLESLRVNPGASNAHYNLGIILTSQGRTAEAVAHCSEAHRLTPSFDTPLCRRTP